MNKSRFIRKTDSFPWEKDIIVLTLSGLWKPCNTITNSKLEKNLNNSGYWVFSYNNPWHWDRNKDSMYSGEQCVEDFIDITRDVFESTNKEIVTILNSYPSWAIMQAISENPQNFEHISKIIAIAPVFDQEKAFNSFLKNTNIPIVKNLNSKKISKSKWRQIALSFYYKMLYNTNIDTGKFIDELNNIYNNIDISNINIPILMLYNNTDNLININLIEQLIKNHDNIEGISYWEVGQHYLDVDKNYFNDSIQKENIFLKLKEFIEK